MHTNDVQEIEVHIEHAKEAIAFGEAIERLISNRDFQLVIDKGYTTDEARRLTLLMGDPAIANKAPLVVSLQAIGELHQFLRSKLGYAAQMKYEMERAQEIMAEEEEAE